jgi:CRP-like cAMP-binding protein
MTRGHSALLKTPNSALALAGASMAPRNLLLAALPAEVRERLAKHSRTVDLKLGEILQKPGDEIKRIYFPLDCLISVTVNVPEARTAKAGLVGSREMVGLNAFMGGRGTNQTEFICESPGAAVRVAAKPFVDEFNEDKRVRDVMLRYTRAYLAQLSQNVGCIRIHSLEQRLARWMLECRDRLQSDDLASSHEFISQMLGVRWSELSETAAALQQRKLIENGRTSLRVVDAAGLEGASCGCFRAILEEYDRLLGPAIERGGLVSVP